jgi:hypothetical protein
MWIRAQESYGEFEKSMGKGKRNSGRGTGMKGRKWKGGNLGFENKEKIGKRLERQNKRVEEQERIEE